MSILKLMWCPDLAGWFVSPIWSGHIHCFYGLHLGGTASSPTSNVWRRVHFSVLFVPSLASLWLIKPTYSVRMRGVFGFDAPKSLVSCNLNPNCIKIVEISLVKLLWSLFQQTHCWLQTEVWAFRATRPVPLVMITSFPPSVYKKVCSVHYISSRPWLHLAHYPKLLRKPC